MPVLATAYRLKEDFSDILQLNDRQKAEDATDYWLTQVYGFVDEFNAAYQGTGAGGRRCPFANIPTTITKWRAPILNYIDYKRRLNFKASNGFAEGVNGKIKAARALSRNCSYETVRVKLIHGGVMVRRRPPHPLGEEHTRSAPARKTGAGGGVEEIGQAANVARLAKAREGSDRTKGLIPRPGDNPDWRRRFGPLCESLAEGKFEEMRRDDGAEE